MTGILIKKGNLDADMHIRRRPCKHDGRDGVVMLPQAIEPRRLPANHRKLGRDKAGSLYWSQREHNPIMS